MSTPTDKQNGKKIWKGGRVSCNIVLAEIITKPSNMFKVVFFSLISFLITSTLFCQSQSEYERYIAVNNGGVCAASLYMYNDRTNCLERDCEGNSHLSIGSWEKIKDSIKFHPIDNKNFRLIENITTSKTSEKFVKVIVLDRNGINVTDKVSVGQLVKGKGIFMMKLDSLEMTRTDFKRDSSKIVLKSLEKIFQQKLEIMPDSSNCFTISLNISCECFWSTHGDWGGYGGFTLMKTENKLISVQANPLDFGNAIGTEYIKENK